MLPNQQRPGNINIMINILSFTASALLSISCLVASSYVNGTSHSIILFSFTISYTISHLKMDNIAKYFYLIFVKNEGNMPVFPEAFC
jgi:hypothetical protein